MENVFIKGVSGGEKTTPAVTDAIPLDDGTTSTYTLLSNLLKIVNGLTEDTAPAGATDFALTYDTSASAPKKVKPDNFAADTMAFTDITTNNASTTKHGFLAKIPNDPNKTVSGKDGTWVPRSVYKSADETVNNSSTLQNDDALLFAIGASEVWHFQLQLYVNAASGTGDFKCGWTLPASGTMLWAWTVTQSGSVTGWGHYAEAGTPIAVATLASTLTSGTIAGTHALKLEGTIFNSSTAGNAQFQWAQATANASDTKVLAGSNLLLWRLA